MQTLAPGAVATGTATYYRERLADFVQRFPDHKPPPYYLAYGDKCLHQFLDVEPRLTADRSKK